MTRKHRLPRRLFPIAFVLSAMALIALAAALPDAARAQELSTYTVGVLAGVGGSPDVDPGSDLGNGSFQVNLGLTTETNTVLGLRVGHLSLDRKPQFGNLTDAGLTYATIGGEYRFNETYYQSGIYLALGAYHLTGNRVFDRSSRSQTAVGAALGFTGEFPINSHLGILIELSGHYTPLDEAKTFAMGHAGVAFHF